MNIRPYQDADEAKVVGLWERCGLTRPWNNPQRDIQRKQTVQAELFVVGELGGIVVATAMAGFDGHRGWVNYLAVDPDYQGHGFGRRLMAHLESQLAAMGCPKINLQIRESNAAVRAFYRKLDYEMDPVISLGKRLISDTE